MNEYIKCAKKNRRTALIVLPFILLDAVCSFFICIATLWIRFDFSVTRLLENEEYLDNAIAFSPVYVLSLILICLIFRLYQSIWKYAGFLEFSWIIATSFLMAGIHVGGSYLMSLTIPRSCYFIAAFLLLFYLCVTRFGYRAVRLLNSYISHRINSGTKNVMIIGAGAAGRIIMREMMTSSYLNEQVRCFIDDDETKVGRFINGIPIIGGRDRIQDAVVEYKIDKIIIAIPSAPYTTKRELIEICKKTDCDLKMLPGLYQLIDGKISMKSLRDVRIEDLLGREPVTVNVDEISSEICGRVVLVTGGGGSIGSELCRQVASRHPRQLIILDIYENSAYEIQNEIKSKYPDLNLVVIIASIRDAARMDMVFNEYRPDIVYHAAAHKHVPLMEENPNEAIKNNVLGTLNTVRAADKYKTKKFVLISTDKAVNPTNIMGASKRICEMIIQDCNRKSSTDFVAVRFGNVLDSNGSVVPLFKKQIEAGGPVTVTHPDIKRFFMTIPEAVSLVLQAGYYAHGGEIFILDMGEPVKIDDLARNMIRLYNLRPDVDIKIVYTGLRPGEKLYEEIFMPEENLRKTDNSLIYICEPIEYDANLFNERLNALIIAAENNAPNIKELTATIVESYSPQNDNSSKSDKEEKRQRTFIKSESVTV